MPVPVQKDPDKQVMLDRCADKEVVPEADGCDGNHSPSVMGGESVHPLTSAISREQFQWEVPLAPEEWDKVKSRSPGISKIVPVLPYRPIEQAVNRYNIRSPRRQKHSTDIDEDLVDPEIVEYYRQHPHGRLDLVIAMDGLQDGRKKILQIQLQHGQTLEQGHMIAPAVGKLRQITAAQLCRLGNKKLVL